MAAQGCRRDDQETAHRLRRRETRTCPSRRSGSPTARCSIGNQSHCLRRSGQESASAPRPAVVDRLLRDAEDRLGPRHRRRGSRSSISPMARPARKSRSTRDRRNAHRPGRHPPRRRPLAQSGRSISARSRADSCRAWGGSPPRSWSSTAQGRLSTHAPSTYKIPSAIRCPGRFPRAALRLGRQPRGHHLSLEGGRRAAADAGDLGVLGHHRCDRRLKPGTCRRSMRRRPRKRSCGRSMHCGR